VITPNKLISLDESVLSMLGTVLDSLNGSTPIKDLFGRVAEQFESIEQFLLAIDVLYVLGSIDVDLEEGIISSAS
jgi:hypothetical protein